MNKGFDTMEDLSQAATSLKNDGYSFVGRYYNVLNKKKNLTRQEAIFLSNAGIRIVAVWENASPTHAGYFSYLRGFHDGTHAYTYASSIIGQPALSPIYFAVDYDAPAEDIEGNSEDHGAIARYFKGVADAFHLAGNGNPAYSIGVYGSGLVCRHFLNNNTVTHAWLSQSAGWRGSRAFDKYNIKQEETTSIELNQVTYDIDGDISNGDEGSFLITTNNI